MGRCHGHFWLSSRLLCNLRRFRRQYSLHCSSNLHGIAYCYVPSQQDCTRRSSCLHYWSLYAWTWNSYFRTGSQIGGQTSIVGEDGWCGRQDSLRLRLLRALYVNSYFLETFGFRDRCSGDAILERFDGTGFYAIPSDRWGRGTL